MTLNTLSLIEKAKFHLIIKFLILLMYNIMPDCHCICSTSWNRNSPVQKKNTGGKNSFYINKCLGIINFCSSLLKWQLCFLCYKCRSFFIWLFFIIAQKYIHSLLLQSSISECLHKCTGDPNLHLTVQWSDSHEWFSRYSCVFSLQRMPNPSNLPFNHQLTFYHCHQ